MKFNKCHYSNIIKFIFFILLCFGRIELIIGQELSLKSPNEILEAEVQVIDEEILIRIFVSDTLVLKLEEIKLISNRSNLKANKIVSIARNSTKEEIIPVIKEKRSKYNMAYNEIKIDFDSDITFAIRLFDNGLAYRFITQSEGDITIHDEGLKIDLVDSDSAYFQAQNSFNSSYEQPYDFRSIKNLEKNELYNLPFLVCQTNNHFVMITEADLFKYPGLWLQYNGNQKLKAVFPKFPRNYIETDNYYRKGQINETEDFIGVCEGNRTYPWRIFAIAENEFDLLENDMVFLLSSPESGNFDWVEPGVVMFDWWGKNNIYGVDFEAGINTETAKYFIDFCAEYGFKYFLFDDGWSSKSDLLNPIDGLNIEEVVQYANNKGVKVMLWVIWYTLKEQWEEVFDQFSKWGIEGIKMDFMNRDDQEMVSFYELVAKEAADRKMVVNYHGAYKPSGLRRKFPNVLTREALIEFEYNGVSDYDNPTHHNLLPYIRMFTGPMDYIPGTFRNSNKNNFRPILDYPMGQGTRAHSMALFVILNSPMTMLPGSPSDYYRDFECTEILAKIPVEWDETKLLMGKIGKYTVMARKSDDDWFVGAITNESSRKVNLKFDFLDPGFEYRIHGIQDGINADIAATDYKIFNQIISVGDEIQIDMKPGGGWICIIEKIN